MAPAGLRRLRQRPVQDRKRIGEAAGRLRRLLDPREGQTRIALLPVAGVARQRKAAGGIVAQCLPGGGGDLGADTCRFAQDGQHQRGQCRTLGTCRSWVAVFDVDLARIVLRNPSSMSSYLSLITMRAMSSHWRLLKSESWA